MKSYWFCPLLLALVGCNMPKPIDYTQIDYDDIPYAEFQKLDHDTQYKIKYKNDCDSIITVERQDKVPVYDENGQPHTLKDTILVDTIILTQDKIIFLTDIKGCKASLHFFTTEKVYDKRKKDFIDMFDIDFLKDKNNKYLYLPKDALPNLNGIGYFTPFKFNISLYYGLHKKSFFNEYENEYRFSESHTIYKGMLGYLNGKPNPDQDIFVLEENEMSKFLKYLDYKGKSVTE